MRSGIVMILLAFSSAGPDGLGLALTVRDRAIYIKTILSKGK